MRLWRKGWLMLGLLLPLVALQAVFAHAASQLLHKVDDTPLAEDFELPDLDGNLRKLSDFRGKVVIVNFWATWCPPCRAEIPSMQRAWNILKQQDVMMLAVHVGGNEDKVWTFLTDFKVDFPVLLDKSSKVSRNWPMLGLPVTFIIDSNGHMALRAIGGREWDDEKLIEQVLGLRE